MKFGSVPVEEAVGALSVHSVQAGEVRVRKGRILSAEDTRLLKAAGIGSLTVARLELEDVGEDEAALKLASHLAGDHVTVEPPFTGRANLHAAADGILLIDRAAIDATNGIDEAITCATLPAYRPVVTGEMIATVKIIPYSVQRSALDRALSEAGKNIRVAPYRLRSVAAISTILPGLKPSVIDKSVDILRKRLAPSGARVSDDVRISHESTALSHALVDLAQSTDLIVVFGASAIADRRDVIPVAIELAGGSVEHFGMPVDPGNLLLLGYVFGNPVIGAPGCARSPKENGFDWVLQRLLAGLPVTRADITQLGVGGLLMEILSRPQPRAGFARTDESDPV